MKLNPDKFGFDRSIFPITQRRGGPLPRVTRDTKQPRKDFVQLPHLSGCRAFSTTNYIRFMGLDTAQSLALQRTLLAHERTLMASVRTSTSLISFGFTIYKFFAYLIHIDPEIAAGKLIGPWEFAIGMISIGVLALMLAVVQGRRALKLLQARYGVEYSSLAEKIAALLAFVGLVLLTLVLLRW